MVAGTGHSHVEKRFNLPKGGGRLGRVGPPDNAVGFKASRAVAMKERFANLRAQSFHHLGVEFEEGRMAVRPGLDQDLTLDLREELLVHSRVHQADQRILVAPKDSIKRTLGRSPDLADALSMTYLQDLRASERRRVRVY